MTRGRRGPKFNSQQTQEGSQPSVQLQCAHIHKINLKKMKRSQLLGKKEEAGLLGPREEKEAQEEEMSIFTARTCSREGRMESRNC